MDFARPDHAIATCEMLSAGWCRAQKITPGKSFPGVIFCALPVNLATHGQSNEVNFQLDFFLHVSHAGNLGNVQVIIGPVDDGAATAR